MPAGRRDARRGGEQDSGDLAVERLARAGDHLRTAGSRLTQPRRPGCCFGGRAGVARTGGARMLLGGSASEQRPAGSEIRTRAFWESARPDALHLGCPAVTGQLPVSSSPDVANHAKGQRAPPPKRCCKPVRFGLSANGSSCVAPPIWALLSAASCRTKVLELVPAAHSGSSLTGRGIGETRCRLGGGERPALPSARDWPCVPADPVGLEFGGFAITTPPSYWPQSRPRRTAASGALFEPIKQQPASMTPRDQGADLQPTVTPRRGVMQSQRSLPRSRARPSRARPPCSSRPEGLSPVPPTRSTPPRYPIA